MDLADKRILVIGMAKTGQATVRFLREKGSFVCMTDEKPSSLWEDGLPAADAPDGRCCVRAYARDAVSGIDLVIPSPGVPPHNPLLQEARERGIPILSEIEVAAAFLQTPMIAVTGTNGKTTTTRILGDILAAAGRSVFVGGNIGNPLIDYVRGQQGHSHAVVEVSSFQLQWIRRFHPRVALLLNITRDHGDYHGGFEAYRAAKERIFENQREEDLAVLNAEDPATERLAGRLRARISLFSTRRTLERGIFLLGERIVHRGSGGEPEIYPREMIRLPGDHNVENVMAAILAARFCGCLPEDIRAAVTAFRGIPHRIEYTATRKGVAYYNDSKGTNVGAVRRALESFTRPVVLLMGGRDKDGDFEDLAPLLREKAKHLILFGEAARRIEERIGGIVATRRVQSLEEAVGAAGDAAMAGDAVLLSPGCASFDAFQNYQERGFAFRRIVEVMPDA